MENPEELLGHLDPEQREVAVNLSGPMCVLAGAGTGKTRAITYRIAYGIASGAYEINHVLAVTFTAKAASEMRSRLRDLGVGTVQARTFHSAALSQLRYFWPQAIGGTVPEVKESKLPYVAQAASGLGISTDSVTVRDLAAEVEWSKVSLITPEDYPMRAAAEDRKVADLSPAEVGSVIRAYEEAKSARGVIDFEDVILILIGIMRDRPDIAATIRQQYRHFVVDEYQDVSPMQHRLLQLWLGDRKDLCVVGDVSQTIYTFTGASSSYLANFTKEFPRAKKVVLNRDYRSTEQIVDLANEIISEDGSDGAVYLKSMVGSGRPVTFSEYADDASEASEIAGRILTLRDQGIDLQDIAVLYRTNAQSAEFENACSQAGIPVTVRGSTRFFQRREVRDAMVALRAVARGENSADLPQLVSDTFQSMGWRPTAPESRGAERERWESLETLRALAADRWEKRKSGISEFVAELEERAKDLDEPTVNAVTLSTLHAAKGLEWQAVFLAGMSEGLMPISLAKDPELVAEERRLLYVGITRAKEELAISYAKGNPGRSNRKVSRFIEGHWPKPESRATSNRRKSAAEKSAFAEANPHDQALFEELRAWRAAEATELGRPAYGIVHDTTLREIAVLKPKDLAELGRIKGIGTTKLTQFGPAILSIVHNRAFGSGASS